MRGAGQAEKPRRRLALPWLQPLDTPRKQLLLALRQKAGMVIGMELAEVKQAMSHKVLYQPAGSEIGTPYILTGCILRRRKNGTFFYQAEIMDIATKRSVVICSLEDIQKIPTIDERGDAK